MNRNPITTVFKPSKVNAQEYVKNQTLRTYEAETYGDDQNHARALIEDGYTLNPEIMLHNFAPFLRNTKLPSPDWVFGDGGHVYNRESGRLIKDLGGVDWIRSLNHIVDALRELGPPNPENQQLPIKYEDDKGEYYRLKIIELLKENPSFNNKLHPIGKDGEEKRNYVLINTSNSIKKSNGQRLNNGKKRNTILDSIDWPRTYNIIHEKFYGDTRKPISERERVEAFARTYSGNTPGTPDTIPEHGFQTPSPKPHERRFYSNALGDQADSAQDSTYSTPPTLDLSGKGLHIRRLSGRGLRGRGYEPSSLMLKEYLYQPMGDKFIHLKSLSENFLVVKYPSGNSYSKRLKISKAVASLIRDFIFDKKFEVSSYNRLNNADQKVIYDLFIVTKLNRTYQLENPYDEDGSQLRDEYQAELDKLVGELQLGNRNKKNIDELIKLASYLFKHDAISNSQFSNYMSLVV
ncbi:hypothetical protein AaE_014141 [Aphanomyces astaci]|uniref:Uncharacterized protein n=1 Tax=Aphanomyces astaci TaxID=112090 RepID=A0A6A4Z1F3_APHAT|nr:hypothetical protein AaE_014141 [Aphanomyces astaci]